MALCGEYQVAYPRSAHKEWVPHPFEHLAKGWEPRTSTARLPFPNQPSIAVTWPQCTLQTLALHIPASFGRR